VAFTDNCDLYAAVDEAGLNLIARHLMRQRPSLFNYATTFISQHPQLACEKIDFSGDITTYNNPLFTVESPLPLLGVDAPPVALNYCAQLTQALVDFFPGNAIVLPPELNPPLPAQHFALKTRLCAGLDCASNQLGDIEPGTRDTPPIVPTGRKLDCFCLDGFVIGHATIREMFGTPTLVGEVDMVDVVEIAPVGLKQAVNCYLFDTLELLLREKLTFPVIHTFFFDFAFLKLPSITVEAAPNPPVPNNPAIEDNQLKIFIDFQVGP
jgi:hypothetical protein